MKIIIFISSLRCGGAEKQAVLDANLLKETFDVLFLCFRGGPLEEGLSKEVQKEVIEKRSYLATAWDLRRKIRTCKIDVIHASLFAPIVVSSLASIGTNAKVVWHFHSHEYDIPLRSRWAFKWISWLPTVRKILFVNHELLAHFSSYRFPKWKTGVQYNHSEMDGRSSTARRPADATVHIGYLGRVTGLKRVHYLVDLAEHFLNKGFSDFKIHIVGDGDALDHIKAQAGEKRVDGFMFFHGFQTDVKKYYALFDYFVNPSREECLSVAMIDAGMMSLPMVAFDVGGNNEIVEHGKTGFLVKDKEAFFQQCLLLAQNEEVRNRFGVAARRHCRRRFSKEKHADQLQCLYKEILHDP